MKMPDHESPALRVVLASVPHHEDLVAEIWLGDELLAEVFVDHGELRTRLYPRADSAHWVLVYEDFIASLRRAREALAPSHGS